jgi:hypothetical protein
MRKLSAISILLVLTVALSAVGLAQAPRVEPVPFVIGGGQPGTVSGIQDVLWEQVYDGYGWWASQCFPDLGGCYYTADDFVSGDVWSIDTIFVDGDGPIENADALNWVVYVDGGGVPAGYPGDGGELWSLSLAPSAPGVTLNGGQVTVDLIVATGNPVQIPPGHWWLIFYPDMLLNPYGQWGWNSGSPNQYYSAAQYNFQPPWVPQYPGMAFRLEGEAGQPQLLHINKTRAFQHPSAPWVVKVTAQLAVYDENNLAVSGALVSGEWTLPDLAVVPGVPFFGVTDYLGREKLQLKDYQTGMYEFCVTDITLPGYSWDPGDPLACMSVYVP